MKNEDIALELLEIKMGISAIADKQHDDSVRTAEVYDRVFKNGLTTDIAKTKIKIENIEGWKKNINRIAISIISSMIIAGLYLLFFGTNFFKVIK